MSASTCMKLEHTAAGGTVLDGTARSDAGAHAILKAQGWRWGRSIGMWYVPYSRDRAPKLDLIDQTAAMLRAAGLEVVVTVDAAPRDQLAAEADRAAHMADRAERLGDRANRRASESDQHWQAAHDISDRIPFGQPILVDHYSARRHRRDLERIDTHHRHAVELRDEADRAARAADSARTHMDRREDPQRVARRIETLAAELRSLERKLDGTSNDGVEYGKPATGAWRTQLQIAAVDLRDKLAYWRGVRADQVAAGTIREWTPADFRPGDLVQRKGWNWGRVVRVNRTTLTVTYQVPGHRGDWPGKLPYFEITDHRRPGAVEQPAPPPVVIAEPAAPQPAAAPPAALTTGDHVDEPSGQRVMALDCPSVGQLVMAL
jgi:hypothetical protein